MEIIQIEEYISAFPDEVKVHIEAIRKIVREVMPRCSGHSAFTNRGKCYGNGACFRLSRDHNSFCFDVYYGIPNTFNKRMV